MKPKKSTQKKPMLDRVYLEIPNGMGPDNMLKLEQRMLDRYYGRNNYEFGTPEQRTLKKALESPNVYFDAGTLPEIIITPPKDNAVYKINLMIPNKDVRNSFYNGLYSDRDGSGFYYPDTFDRRMYINRLYLLYNKSQKPNIKSVLSDLFNTIPFLQKIGIMGGFPDRAHYSPITNTLYIDPDFAVSDIEAELAHAYLFMGTDTPRSLNWMKLFLSIPNGDIKINGKDGYNRPGHLEFVAHLIIEPIFHSYLTDKTYGYGDARDDINYVYNNGQLFFSPVESGPFKGTIKQLKPLKR